MVQKKGLGRGLNVLIPDMPSKEEPIENIEDSYVNISEIETNRGQPRKQFDEEELRELADSIERFGILQPLIVQKREGYYEIIAGERRYKAAQIAGLKKVPVIIKEYTSREMAEVALIENIQRKDLNSIEEAIAFKKLIEEFDLTHEEIAEKISKSRATVTNALRLLKLDERVQELLIQEKISTAHARTILGISDFDGQYHIALKIIEESLSVRETEAFIKQLQKKQEDKKQQIQKREEKSIYFCNAEENMKEIIGTKVMIKNKKNNSGKIEIEYYSKEELERIVELFEKMKLQ